MGHPAASAIAVMGAWSVGLVNVEGAYRQQATAKIAAAISITAMLFLANLVDGTLWLSALTMFLVMFIAGFVSLFGQAASSISLTTQGDVEPIATLILYTHRLFNSVTTLAEHRRELRGEILAIKP